MVDWWRERWVGVWGVLEGEHERLREQEEAKRRK